MKGKRYETHEPAGLVLKLSKLDHVIHPVFVGLNVSVEHSGVRGDAAAVNLLRQLQPSFTRGLMCANPAASWIAKDLRAAARAAIQSRGDQSVDYFFVRHPADACQMVQLDHRKSLQMHVGEIALQLAEER